MATAPPATSPSCGQQPLHHPGGPSRSSSSVGIAPPSHSRAREGSEHGQRRQLPAVYNAPTFVRDGGLISYGPDLVEQFRQAAGYVDRVLKGEKPADIPVQAPTKYELAINLKTAKTLALELPTTVLARADEVIE
jgi:ABC-type uncharacterized transport system substrate-binding protein